MSYSFIESIPGMDKVTTQQNDTWDKISLRVYGSTKYANKLIESNIYHRKKVIFNSGIVLNVPKIDVEEDFISDDLPIWKR